MECTKCHSADADWLGIDGEDLCQLCWEAYSSETWWDMIEAIYYKPQEVQP